MKGYRHLTEGQRRAVVESYQQSRSTRMTAEALGVSLQRVQAALRKAGIPLSAAHGGVCYRRHAEVRVWAAEGLSLSEMARRLGTKRQMVSKFLRDMEIPYVGFRQAGENNPSWKGGRMLEKGRYVLIHQPRHPAANRHGYVREHRLVMEGVLGRLLEPHEVVHHLDGDGLNNAPENLELYASNGEHLAATRKGKAPMLSASGRERIRESTSRMNKEREATNPRRRGPDGRLLPETIDRNEA